MPEYLLLCSLIIFFLSLNELKLVTHILPQRCFIITKSSDKELYLTLWTPNLLQICKWEVTMPEKSLETLTSVWREQPFHNPVDLKHSRHWNLFSTWGRFLNMFSYCWSSSCCLNMASIILGSQFWYQWHIKIISLINGYYQTIWPFFKS